MRRNVMTETKKATLNFILNYIQSNQRAPSTREIAAGIGKESSIGNVSLTLKDLERRELIQRRNIHRGIVAARRSTSEEWTRVYPRLYSTE